MPYSIAITLSLYAIRYNHELNVGTRDKNSFLDIFLFGLAVGNRLEFIILLPLFLNSFVFDKKLLYRRILTFILAVLVFAPWVILYPIGPTKILLGYILAHKSMIFILLSFLIMSTLLFKFGSYSFIMGLIMTFLLLIIVTSFLDDRVSIRWALGPSLIMTVSYILQIKSKWSWLEGRKLNTIIVTSLFTALCGHAYLYQGTNSWDHRFPNLVEEFRINDEMQTYISCVVFSKSIEKA